MYTGTKSNEELVELYRGTKDERYLSDLLEQNAGIIYLLAEPFVHTIPNAELEDLIQEANIALVKAVAEFDVNKGYTFTTFLKGVVRQRLSRIYNAETRKKRYSGAVNVSYEGLAEINKEGGSEGDRYFTVECEDINAVEFNAFLDGLHLSEKEQIVVRRLMNGDTKGEVARALKCTPATANYYFKRLRQKFIIHGYVF